jgi:hypothetical protein
MTNAVYNKYQLASDIVLTTFDGKKYTLASPSNKTKDVEIMSIKIFESIDTPYLLAEMNVTDVALNLVGSIPLQGMETITFSMKTPYFSEEVYNYEFRIYAIRNRYVSNKIQNYTLDLITYEGLANEATRVGSTMTGTGDKIVQDILKKYLNASSKISSKNFEKCQYEMKFIPSNKRPFDLISQILPKCISSSATFPASNNSKTSLPSTKNQKASSTTNTPSKETAENISGSSGYCFWETQKGYMFKSIDMLCSSGGKFKGEEPKDTFIYQLANVENRDPGKNIIEYNYVNEIDVLKKMRYGTYSSMMVFFNPSTGQYEEYVFDIEKSYAGMAHLGKDEKIPEGPKQLSKYPTRIMTQVIDHETFYNGDSIASPDPKDGATSGTTRFPDFKKYYMAQSIGRSLLLGNQQLEITINGNLSLRAGDKINILLPKFSVEEKKTDTRYDKQHSGTYLIKSISYEFYLQKGNQSNVTVSNITLIRDSFGIFNLEI